MIYLNFDPTVRYCANYNYKYIQFTISSNQLSNLFIMLELPILTKIIETFNSNNKYRFNLIQINNLTYQLITYAREGISFKSISNLFDKSKCSNDEFIFDFRH